LKYAGRGPLATPAVGIGQMHQKEAEMVTVQPFTIRWRRLQNGRVHLHCFQFLLNIIFY